MLGRDDFLPVLLAKGVRQVFIAIGHNLLRLRLLAKVSEICFELINVVSPNAVVSPSATLDRGIAITAGAVINASAQIGNVATVDTNANVDHGCCIGDEVHIGPGSALAGML